MTTESVLSDLRQHVEQEYLARTPRSRALHIQAEQCLPGGDTRSGNLFRPYPTWIDAGRGAELVDVDGNVLLDFTFNSTSLIHGHAHRAVVDAIQYQAARGTAWNAPNSTMLALAEAVCTRVPSVQLLRFCNSGTEANMQAIKAARAFSGRDLILKMDGVYHGTYEGVEINLANARPAAASAGVARNAADNVVLAPFNDAESATRIIRERRNDLAAVVVTPILTRPSLGLPVGGYLQSLRDVTRECGVLLIFDEVISLRIADGGAQAWYGIGPDLTAMGKIIGGGLPVGAVGGRADVMRVFGDHGPGSVVHAGTFNGNPLTAAAGLATMKLLTGEAYAYLEHLGTLVRTRLRRLFDQHGLAFDVTAIGSLASFDLPASVRGNPSQASSAAELLRLVQLRLLCRGIKTYGLIVLSTVTNETHVNRLVAELDEAFQDFRPAIEATTPGLLSPVAHAV